MCLPSDRRMIEACQRDSARNGNASQKGNIMSPALSDTITDTHLSRRSAIRRLATAGTAAALGATQLKQILTAANGPTSQDRSRSTTTREGTTMTDTTAPTIVLVHGAFADSSSWNGVIPALHGKGYNVAAAANPLRSVNGDADYVASVLAGIADPIVLVGHSYGGIVISNAAVGNDNVKALVYVAAFAPDSGESAVSLASQFPGSTLGPALAATPLSNGDGNDLSIRHEAFRSQFAADVPESSAALMAATQRPVTEAALSDISGDPAWKTIPSWFVYGELDKNIPAAAEAFMAERASAKETREVAGASHVVMISQPQAVSDMILAAANAVS